MAVYSPLMGDTKGNTERSGESVRIDRWLWAARFYKTRSQAVEAIDGGKVQVNGQRAKRAKPVRAGDTVRVRKGPFEYVLVVLALSERRGPANEAAGLYRETEASYAAREALAAQLKADPWARVDTKGRPTKKERRDLERLRGRSKR
jgi:ribosome-associated heat shock protein Hsp15